MNICEPGPTLPSGHLPRASGSPNCTLEEERGTSLQPDSRLCAVKVHRPRVRPPTCLSPADFPVLPGMARLRSSPEILPGVPGQMGLAHPYKASTWDRSERARMPSRRMRMRSLAVRSPRPPLPHPHGAPALRRPGAEGLCEQGRSSLAAHLPGVSCFPHCTPDVEQVRSLELDAPWPCAGKVHRAAAVGVRPPRHLSAAEDFPTGPCTVRLRSSLDRLQGNRRLCFGAGWTLAAPCCSGTPSLRPSLSCHCPDPAAQRAGPWPDLAVIKIRQILYLHLAGR